MKDQRTNNLSSNATPEEISALRDREIVKASIIGIAGNMVLVAFKIIVGLLSSSIAIILDGVNNATDALSSIVTIAGTKLAAKEPDKKHPFGYGRIEYLTSVTIASIILAAGVVSLRESIEKIIHPGTPEYSDFTITIIIVAIIVKIALGIVFKKYGDKTKSEALIASGIDSNYDAVLSAGTLVVAIVQNLWNLNIDGIVGVLISLVVCKAGVDVMRDAIDPIIGVPEDKGQVEAIKSYILTFPNIKDVHDVILTDFGPNKIIGSVHIKVPDDMSAGEICELTRSISKGLKERYGVEVTVGIYALNTSSEYAPMEHALDEIIASNDKILGVHAFYVDRASKKCFFDLVIQFKADREAVGKDVVSAMSEKFPDYSYDVVIDVDYSE